MVNLMRQNLVKIYLTVLNITNLFSCLLTSKLQAHHLSLIIKPALKSECVHGHKQATVCQKAVVHLHNKQDVYELMYQHLYTPHN